MKQITKKKSLGFLYAFIAFHVIWFVASSFVSKNILPNPWNVYKNLPTLWENHILLHLWASLKRILLGMFIALGLGTICGIIMGQSIRWNHLLNPLLYLIYPLPKLAFLPVLMLLFGLGEASKILLIIFIVFPQVVLAVRDAVVEIPKDYYYIYECMQARKMQKFWQITFPASLNAIFSSARLSLGTAISVLFFTENYGTEFGMGYFIMDSWLRMDYLTMYGAILVLSLLGLLLFVIIDSIRLYCIRW